MMFRISVELRCDNWPKCRSGDRLIFSATRNGQALNEAMKDLKRAAFVRGWKHVTGADGQERFFCPYCLR
jgi:hypothetical protein